MPSFQTALVQYCSSTDWEENVAGLSALVRQAAAEGAEMVCLPETSSFMARNREALFAAIVDEAEDKALAAFRALAKELNIWLLPGSLCVRSGKASEKAANRAFVIAPDGNIRARYDKIHLFDVQLSQEQHRESANYDAGSEVTTAELPWGVVGMSVCYDLRFPALYRELARRGAAFLTVPSAFTRETGEAHWHVLLRARAIENGCFVFAAAQAGEHENGRRTYGHSLIIDPWGVVLAEAEGMAAQVISARVDAEEVAAARGRIPVLTHERGIPSLSPPPALHG